jgi:hypothetical protein
VARDAGAPAPDGGAVRDGGSVDGGGSGQDGGAPAVDGGAVFDGGSAAPDGGGAPRVLGADCQVDADCATGVCLQLTVAGSPYSICAKLCCSEGECPASDGQGNRFGCIEFYGANVCLTDRIFASAGVRFQQSVGQACGPTSSDNWCRSGICRSLNGTDPPTCAATCCSTSDCGASTCAFRPPFSPGEISHHVCELNLNGAGMQGAICQSELDCAAYMCIPLGAQPFCADTCCTSRDCPSGFACQQLENGPSGSSNVGTACLPAGSGTAPEGAPCTEGAMPNECASSVCANGVCRNPCCRDDHCPAGQVCRAVDNGETLSGLSRHGLTRVCMSP